MSPTAAELLAALPDEVSSETTIAEDQLKALFEQLSRRPVPTGSLQRL